MHTCCNAIVIVCVLADSHIYHGFNPSDAASDTPIADRQKMYTHERMSCGYGSMLRYAKLYICMYVYLCCVL
jgi:hypothetical protein